MDDYPEEDLEQALEIIDGTSMMLPELRHLVALHKFHQGRIAQQEGRTCHEYHQSVRPTEAEAPSELS